MGRYAEARSRGRVKRGRRAEKVGLHRAGDRWKAARNVLAISMAVLLLSCGTEQFPCVAASTGPPCALWVAIGDSPTPAEITSVGRRYRTVIMNAWDTEKMRLLRTANPDATILVYKDLSSTRSYPGAVDNGIDATYLPTGVGYVQAQSTNQEWFARNANGERIEWSSAFPGHWQMAVWDQGYQRAWAEDVVNQVAREGWDGVFADNDLSDLGHYTNELIAGTSSSEETNQRLRDGLNVLTATAGQRLNEAGKLFVPNVSDARLFPGRWTERSRFGGAMEENFSLQDPSGENLTVQSPEWDEMIRQSQDGSGLLLLVNHGSGAAALETGFVASALLAGDKTCWSAQNDDYRNPAWSTLQDVPLGSPVSPPVREGNGAWHREFTGGWVVLNPTGSATSIAVPAGMQTLDHLPASEIYLPPGGSEVLVR